jgi:hypothetical protein
LTAAFEIGFVCKRIITCMARQELAMLNSLWKRARYIAQVARGCVVCNDTRACMAQRLNIRITRKYRPLSQRLHIKDSKEASKKEDNFPNQQHNMSIKIILARQQNHIVQYRCYKKHSTENSPEPASSISQSNNIF